MPLRQNVEISMLKQNLRGETIDTVKRIEWQLFKNQGQCGAREKRGTNGVIY